MSSPRPRTVAKAYSYLRFSTPEQMKGDSFRRQTAMAQDYANRNGLELDEKLTFHDLGVSAFRGQNAEAGRLAYFLEAVRAGHVSQGSFLLVEQLDRLSRLAPRRAFRVLEDIVEAGVTVVTLNDGRTYTAESLDKDPTDLMVSILTFMRANEESATKARRLKAAWDAKRANLRTKPLTSKAPAWLRLNREEGAFEIIPERGELVRRIFSMTLDAIGQHKIAETFNREGFKPWGRGKLWHRSYIAKILSNTATIGTLTPHLTEYDGNRKGRTPLEPVEGYFPAVIEPEVFAEVQALQAGSKAPARGRHASKPILNILAGMATCPLCGGTMTRVQKGKKSHPSLVCASAKAGAGCAYKSVRYLSVEEAILTHLQTRLADAPAGGGAAEIDRQLVNVEGLLDELGSRIEVTLDNLTRSRSPALSETLRKLEDELDALRDRRDGLLERRTAATGKLVMARVDKVREALQAEPMDPERLNQALRSIFTRAVINYPDGTIDFEWVHGGECSLPYAWPLNSPFTDMQPST